KFHCCRTISRKEFPRSGDHLRMNSCVRETSVSTNTNEMRLRLCGWSKISRMVCTPASAARHPFVASCDSADSIGKALSSSDKAQRQADQLEKKARHPAPKKKKASARTSAKPLPRS